MKNKHPKRKLASKMLSKKEKAKKCNPFDGQQWMDRSEAIKKRITKKKKI